MLLFLSRNLVDVELFAGQIRLPPSHGPRKNVRSADMMMICTLSSEAVCARPDNELILGIFQRGCNSGGDGVLWWKSSLGPRNEMRHMHTIKR